MFFSKKINSCTEFYIQDRRGQMSHTTKTIANYRTEMNQNFVQLHAQN